MTTSDQPQNPQTQKADPNLIQWTIIASGLCGPVRDPAARAEAQAQAVAEFPRVLAYASTLAGEIERLKGMAWEIANYDSRGRLQRGD